jgi:hypothetical protein
MYKCGYNGCEKAYGTLNHLNAHVTMQGHGAKRTPDGMSGIFQAGLHRSAHMITDFVAQSSRRFVASGRLGRRRRRLARLRLLRRSASVKLLPLPLPRPRTAAPTRRQPRTPPKPRPPTQLPRRSSCPRSATSLLAMPLLPRRACSNSSPSITIPTILPRRHRTPSPASRSTRLVRVYTPSPLPFRWRYANMSALY